LLWRAEASQEHFFSRKPLALAALLAVDINRVEKVATYISLQKEHPPPREYPGEPVAEEIVQCFSVLDPSSHGLRQGCKKATFLDSSRGLERTSHLVCRNRMEVDIDYRSLG